MKKYLLILMAAFAVCSCSYDDDALWDEVNGLKSEVATLQSLIDALNKGKVITNVEENEDGYTLTFNDGTSVSIKNGENGKDGDSQFQSVVVDGDIVIITLTDGTVLKFENVNYELRVLTFEDDDTKFATYKITGFDGTNYYDHTIEKWSDLVDSPQYGGPITYGDMGYMGESRGCDYCWYDENNTFLASENVAGGPMWNGGHAISNYASMDIAGNGDYLQQLTVYAEEGKGGHNGSKNFCVDFGSASFEFKDGVARIIDHMYVNCTTYLMHVYVNGNGFSKAATEADWFKVIAIGYNAEGVETGKAEYYLCKGTQALTTWEKWDLSSLGKVQKVKFNLEGTDVGDYGLNTPAYFAYDDVAVRF